MSNSSSHEQHGPHQPHSAAGRESSSGGHGEGGAVGVPTRLQVRVRVAGPSGARRLVAWVPEMRVPAGLTADIDRLSSPSAPIERRSFWKH